jgi:chemotaxis protein CheZ
MASTNVDQDLAQRLDTIRRDHGETVHIDQVADVVRSLLETVTGDISAGDLRLYHELESLAEYIHSARAELAELRPTEIKNDFIPTATDELDAIVGATEVATNAILDAAEKLESIASAQDSETSDAISEVITTIYESCNFQDLTGQRITKVVKMLKAIETRVDMLVRVFGDDKKSPLAAAETAEAKPENSDADLLNGPQLPANASDQDEIDKLLASFD